MGYVPSCARTAPGAKRRGALVSAASPTLIGPFIHE